MFFGSILVSTGIGGTNLKKVKYFIILLNLFYYKLPREVMKNNGEDKK